jgi:hypothetical protein
MEVTSAQPGTDRKWYEIWWDVWRHPGTDAFRRMLQELDANSNRGFKWVAVMALIGTVLSSLISMIILQNIVPTAISGSVTSLLCGAIFAPVGAVIGLAISAAIYHWVAKLFDGNGEWGQLVFCLSAIQAPVFLITTLFSFLSSLIFGSFLSQPTQALAQQTTSLGICLVLPSLALSIYSIVLSVCAINVAEDLDTGRSIATVLAPVVIGIVLGCCLFSTILPSLYR